MKIIILKIRKILNEKFAKLFHQSFSILKGNKMVNQPNSMGRT